MAGSPEGTLKTLFQRRRTGGRDLRPLERGLRLAGWGALAWVSWGWVDARLYQAQQERLFADSVGLARLEQLAGEVGAQRTAGGTSDSGRGDRNEGSPDGEARFGTGDGPRAGTRIEIEGLGPARITEVSSQPARGPPPSSAGRPSEAAEAPAGSERQRPLGEQGVLPGDSGWAGHRVGLAALGRLTVPRLGMGVMVAPDVNARSLRRAAGHIPGTALPGADGNAGIAGHRDTFFRPLRRIELGDEIVLTTEAGDARYVVEWTRVVAPEAVEVLSPTPYPALTLVTCYPFYYVGHAPERFIVRARLVDRAPSAGGAATGSAGR